MHNTPLSPFTTLYTIHRSLLSLLSIQYTALSFHYSLYNTPLSPFTTLYTILRSLLSLLSIQYSALSFHRLLRSPLCAHGCLSLYHASFVVPHRRALGLTTSGLSSTRQLPPLVSAVRVRQYLSMLVDHRSRRRLWPRPRTLSRAWRIRSRRRPVGRRRMTTSLRLYSHCGAIQNPAPAAPTLRPISHRTDVPAYLSAADPRAAAHHPTPSRIVFKSTCAPLSK
jgi:hypothetical protein